MRRNSKHKKSARQSHSSRFHHWRSNFPSADRWSSLRYESLEDRRLLSANLTIPSNLNALQGGVIAVPIRVDQLLDTPGNFGLSRADFAINYDASKLSVSGSDIFQGTAPIDASSFFTVNPSFGAGQLEISLTNPISPITSAVRTAGQPITINTLNPLPASLTGISSVNISGVAGFAAANGVFQITVTGLNSFTLNGTAAAAAGNGNGGTWQQIINSNGNANDSIVVVNFHVAAGASLGNTAINLVANNGLGATDMFTGSTPAQTQYTLNLTSGSINILPSTAASAPGFFTAVTPAAAGVSLGTMLLLPDGTVIASAGDGSNNWYQLKPDSSGNYAGQSWGTIQTSAVGRLYFGSVVMKTGQVFVLGGEVSDISGSISSAVGAAGVPITITTASALPTTVRSSNSITLAGITGFPAGANNFNINQTWIITVTGANTFTLNGTVGQAGNANAGTGTFAEGESDTGEIFTPSTTGGPGSWQTITPFPSGQFGDQNVQLMSDGTILAADLNNGLSFRYDVTKDPLINTSLPANSNPWSPDATLPAGTNGETTWTKLPDGSILSYQITGQSNTATETALRLVFGAVQPGPTPYASDQWVPAGNLPFTLSSAGGVSNIVQEIGPAFLLPDGRVFYTGANGNTALYTPPALAGNATGNWAPGPVIPNGQAAADTPGAMMPNGDVLIVVGPNLNNAASSSPFSNGAQLDEYNPATNTITVLPLVNSTNTIINSLQNGLAAVPAYEARTLVLPNGQILIADSDRRSWVYSPAGVPQDAWRPTVLGISPNSDGSYTLSGTQLNGLSEGAVYGDDAQMATNFPLVELTAGDGTISYARTFNWSSAGVATGKTPQTVQFALPPGKILDDYAVVRVIANGIASAPTINGIGPHINLGEFSDRYPGIATANGMVYVAWRGRDNHAVNVMRLNADLSANHATKAIGTTTSEGVALAALDGQHLFVAFKGDSDDNIYIAPATDNGGNNPLTFGAVINLGGDAESGPALASYNGSLYIAWVDNDDFVHIMRLDSTGHATAATYKTGVTAEGSPALGVSPNNQLILGFTGEAGDGEDHLFVGQINIDGDHISLSPVSQLDGELSEDMPALAAYQALPFTAWWGEDNHLNIMQLNPTGTGYAPIEPHPISGETAQAAPALDTNGDSPLIAWTGTDGPGTLYVAPVGFYHDTNGQSIVAGEVTVNAVVGDNTVGIKNLGGGVMQVTLNGTPVNYPPGTIHKITVNTGSGTNIVDVFSNIPDVAVEINSGTGNTTVDVARDNQNLTQLDGPLTINGGTGGNTQLVLFDQLDNGAETYSLTNTTFQSSHSALITYANLQGLAINGGLGNNVLTVDSSTGLVTVPEGIQFDGGGGSNSVKLTQTEGDTQTTDTYRVGPNNGQGSSVVVGPSGTQTIYFQHLAPFFDFIPVTTQNVFATPADNAINYTAGSSAATGYITIDEQESYEFTNKVHLIINALAGSDEINLNNPNMPTGLVDITVNGNDPTASDTLIVNGTTGLDNVNITNITANGALVTGAGPVPITVATVEHLKYNGQNGNDNLTYTAPGNSVIDLFPGVTLSSGAISASINFAGVIGFDYQQLGNGSLTFASDSGGSIRDTRLDYHGTDNSDVFNVDSTGKVTLNRFPTNLVVIPVNTPGVAALVLLGGAGDDIFNVAGNHPFPGFFGSAGITVQGGDPSASDVLNFTAGTATSVKVDLTTSTITEGTFKPVEYVGIERVNLAIANQPLAVIGTAGDDTVTFTLSSKTAGSFTATSTGAFVATNPLFTYTGSNGNIAVDGGSAGGYDTIGIVGTSGNDFINADQNPGGLDITQNGFSVHFDHGGVEDVNIATLGGDDLIRVNVNDFFETNHPAQTLRFDVDGGDPNASDRLIVNDDGLGDLDILRQASDAHSGSVTIGQFAPVNYKNIERMDITPIDPISGGTGSDKQGTIVVFHTDPYEYNDTRLNSAELQRIGANPTGPNIDPGGITLPAPINATIPGDDDWYVFRPQATGTFQVKIVFRKIATLANGRFGLPGTGDLDLDIYDANGVLITSGVVTSQGDGKAAIFAATNDPSFANFNTIYVRVHGHTPDSINTYDFDNIAALITGLPGVSAVDLEGPQVTDVRISDPNTPPVGTAGENLNYNLFGLKPNNAPQGPTPLVNAITINFKDLPARFPGFLYPALDYKLTADQARGLFSVIGDANGQVSIKEVRIHNDGVTLGGVPTGEIQIIFDKALPDDRFTLTISDSLRDPAQNRMDGESNADEPNNGPFFPSGDGHSGGDFVTRFTVDTRPELGNFAAARVFIDINGNSIYDPTNLDFTNRDLNFTMQLDPVLLGRAQLGVHDSVFAGNFAGLRGTADGFDKLALYGTDPVAGVGFRWLLDTDDNGTADLLSLQPVGFNVLDQNGASVKFNGSGIAFAGNFDGNAANGDEIGLWDQSHFFLDTNHNFVIDSGDTVITSALRGFPIVGDFNGDGAIDVGTWQTDVFQFNYGTPGTGGNTGIPIQFTGAKDSIINFGFPGVGEVPLAEDMDHDGITDVGLWVPGRSGSTTGDIAETYFLISNDFDANGQPRNTGLTDPTAAFNLLNHAFSPTPLGSDIYSNYLDEFATPIVGNFDPPVVPATPQLATDTIAPTSSVNALSATQTSRTFNVSWSGTDGSGIAGYDVYVSDNGGNYTLWQDSTTATSATFTGVNGHSYKFFSVATDKAGNVQDTPAAAQATTSIQIRATTTTVLAVSSASSLPGQNVTFTVSVSALDSSNPAPIGTVTFKDGTTVLSTVTLVNGVATFSKANFAAGNHNITATYNAVAPYVASASATVVEHIVNAVLAADPGNSALTALFVAGTTGNDIITIAGASGGGVTVSLNTSGKTTSLGTFKPTGHIFVSGLTGADTLVASNVANTWNITAANAGTLNGNAFDGIENLTGGTSTDVFRISTGGSLSGKISGGAGANSLDYSAYAAANSLNLQTGAATGTAGAAGITNFVGSGASTLVGPNKAVTWNITAANAGNVNGVAFSGTSNLTGGTANDTFAFAGGAGVNGIINGGAGTDSLKYSAYSTPVTVNLSSQAATGAAGIANIEGMVGGSASDTLVGPNQNNAWSITSANTGKVNAFTFTSTENLTGGAANDNFVFNKSFGVAGHIEGSAGINMLDYAAYTTAVNVNLAAGTATNIGGGVSNIRVVRGGSAADTITGDSGDDALIGGAGNDTLTAGGGRNLLFGGLGADTLTGGAGESILFSGTTTFDTNLTSIDNLLTYWARNDLDYATRVAALKAGTAAGAPKLNSTTVKTDTSVNTLNGGSGLDWFFAKLGSPKDTLNNQITGEQVN